MEEFNLLQDMCGLNEQQLELDEKERPLYLAYEWDSAPACLESLYNIKDSLKELESVLMFTYKD